MARSYKSLPFTTFVGRKYKKILKMPKNAVLFADIDDYLVFLFYDYVKCNVEKYYYKLEEDLIEYSNMQLGIKPRVRGK